MVHFSPAAIGYSSTHSSLALWANILALLLAITSIGIAQGISIDPPVADRPEDFSNVVGKYTIKATAEPTEALVEEPITLRIAITGEGPAKYEPQRRHLRLFPAWDDDFYLQPVPDQDKVIREQKTWLFVYRLRPKRANIDAIEGLKLVYYDPSRGGLPKKKFVSSFVDAIPIKVTPKPDKAIDVPVEIVAAPESFYRMADLREALGRGPAQPFSVSALALTLFLAGVPLACLVSALAWRRWFPDDRQLHARQCEEAARRALAILEAGSESAWSIVCRYLLVRFDFSIDDPAPTEVAAFLKRRGFAKALCVQSQAFFQACDTVRFTAELIPKPLTDEATRLIHALEADPCVCR